MRQMQSKMIAPTGSSDYLQAYLARAFNTPLLSREREEELACLMKQGGALGKRARDELVTSHLKLAAGLARKFAVSRGQSLEDLVGEASIGLMIAVDKFEVERGFRFSTMAFHWIVQQLRMYCNDGKGVVRVPISRQRLIRQLTDTIKRLESERRPADETTLAAELGWTAERVREVMDSMVTEFSLNTPIGEGETEIGDLFADTGSQSAEDQLIARQERDILFARLDRLNDRERDIVVMRYGLDGEDERTLEDCSQVYGVTRERIRQIEVKAIEKLRKKG